MTFRCPNEQYYFERIPLSQNIEYRVQHTIVQSARVWILSPCQEQELRFISLPRCLLLNDKWLQPADITTMKFIEVVCKLPYCEFPQHEIWKEQFRALRSLFKATWNHSSNVASSLIKHIAFLKPHNVNSTLSLNLVRDILVGIEAPLAMIAEALQHNLDQTKRNTRDSVRHLGTHDSN